MSARTLALFPLALGFAAALIGSSPASAGGVFVSGHDAIWHSHYGGNATGARNLATTAIEFARDGSPLPFLFVESISLPVPSGNAHEAPFLVSDLGYAATDFVVADIAALNAFPDFRAALDGYSAIVVASDHGGMLSGLELQFLNDHAADIIDYVNAGGGVAAFSESNARGMIGATQRFGFLPFVVSSTDFNESETGNTVTAYGAGLGLVDSDVNGNFSHNFFTATGGMERVDLRNGNPAEPLSLAFLGLVGSCGVGILEPELAVNPPGDVHVVTATVTDDGENPIPGVDVSFEVISGPNAVAAGVAATDANGVATFEYTGADSKGVDEILATYLDEAGGECESNPARKFWDDDCQENGIPDTCDLSCAGFGGACDQFEGCGQSSDDDGNAIPDECVIGVAVDIKPGSCPNSYNPHSRGVLPVAIVGSPEFDVRDVDLSSVVLSRADGVGGGVGALAGPPGPAAAIEDVATAFDGELCDCHELGGDGIADLSLKFDTPELVSALELEIESAGPLPELVVSGRLLDGTPFVGSDCVRLVPSGCGTGVELALVVGPFVWVRGRRRRSRHR